jgi:hypothetical protein
MAIEALEGLKGVMARHAPGVLTRSKETTYLKVANLQPNMQTQDPACW